MDPITQYSQAGTRSLAISRFMSRVYGWMTFGLLITSVVGYVVGNDAGLMQTLLGGRGPFMLLILLQFGLVLGLSFGMNRLSVGAATFCFLLYSFLNGILFSTIFVAYSLASIGTVFGVTAGAFGCLAMYGFVTKKDLNAMGTFMTMGLFGVIIASIVNMFVKSSGLDFVLSIFCVGIFAGLTAWDVQKIKSFASQGDIESEGAHKVAIIGALALYLDFINMFLSLLRIFGGRRD